MKNNKIKADKDIAIPLLQLPFNGFPFFARVRKLNQAQIYACGGNDISLIELGKDKKYRVKRKPSFDEVLSYSKVLHDICKQALVEPSYKEILDILKIGLSENDFKEKKKELYGMLATVKDNTKEFKELSFKIQSLEIRYNLLLPDDFTEAIINYSLSISDSDIKSLTEETLYSAAILSRAGNDNPSDHIEGRFTSFMKDDINKRALLIYEEKQRKIKDVNRCRNHK